MNIPSRFALAILGAASIFPPIAASDNDNSRSSASSRMCGARDSNRSRLDVLGLTTDQRLICFNEYNPGEARSIGVVSGLSGDVSLIGIDYRVQDGKLYGVGNVGGVYTLDPISGGAVKVSQLTIALSGTSFGVDFNPAADRLRVVSDNGQNLRHNVNAGGETLVDGTLTYTAPPAAPIAAIGVTGAAYTNNDLDPNTATTLYDVDTNLDQVAIQSPANNGILAATGKLAVDVGAVSGFDIYSTVRGGVTVEVKGFAALTSAIDGATLLYSVALPTGKALSRGSFRAGNAVVDIAIPLNQR
jgi:Domain of unknown function (DUF4394)